MTQAAMSAAVAAQFERALAHALKPLTARIDQLEQRNTKLEADLLALRKATAAMVRA